MLISQFNSQDSQKCVKISLLKMDKSWIDQPQITVWLANTVTT